MSIEDIKQIQQSLLHKDVDGSVKQLDTLFKDSHTEITDVQRRWDIFHKNELNQLNQQLLDNHVLPGIAIEADPLKQIRIQGTYHGNDGKENYLVFADSQEGPDHQIYLLGSDGKTQKALLNADAKTDADKFLLPTTEKPTAPAVPPPADKTAAPAVPPQTDKPVAPAVPPQGDKPVAPAVPPEKPVTETSQRKAYPDGTVREITCDKNGNPVRCDRTYADSPGTRETWVRDPDKPRTWHYSGPNVPPGEDFHGDIRFEPSGNFVEENDDTHKRTTIDVNGKQTTEAMDKPAAQAVPPQSDKTVAPAVPPQADKTAAPAVPPQGDKPVAPAVPPQGDKPVAPAVPEKPVTETSQRKEYPDGMVREITCDKNGNPIRCDQINADGTRDTWSKDPDKPRIWYYSGPSSEPGRNVLEGDIRFTPSGDLVIEDDGAHERTFIDKNGKETTLPMK